LTNNSIYPDFSPLADDYTDDLADGWTGSEDPNKKIIE
jgi:hypothetical protein